ncbi:MAG: TatD family hydrolase [Candidatus Bathyarchaeota archaeon]|nr:MAG: TatD family hydrolase [Candidatus Bathyarchaeota archaeon]
MLVDSHAHLQWASFDKDREAVVGRAREAGVEYIVNIGFDVDGCKAGVELAERHEGLFATVGIHPHNASQFSDHVLDELRALAGHVKVVAIGEIGLDYYRDLSPREAQKKAFEAQLLLAEELELPVVIHDRDANRDILEVLSKFEGRVEGVMHCFSGGREMAKQCIRAGFHISLAGPVTFQNARRLQELARWISLDKILLETDSPWLAPQEMRGRRNEPAFLPFIARKIAELKGVSFDVVAEATSENAKERLQLE